MSLLEKNLKSLPQALALKIEAAPQLEREIRDVARDGTPINGMRTQSGRRYFHSRYSPLRDAGRLVEQYTAPNLVVLGAGMGYHVRALIEAGRRVILFEPSVSLLKTTLCTVLLADAVDEGRLHLITEPSELPSTLLSWYFPALHGDLAVVPLPGRVESEPGLFDRFIDVVHELRTRLQRDIATQAQFGMVWARNLFNNLVFLTRRNRRAGRRLTVKDLVVVAAAGPSLDKQIPWIAARRDQLTILSTDTAYPVLKGAGLMPDIVISIDASPISYHHFLTASRPSPTLFAELSCPPSVTHHAGQFIPMLSANPLHAALRSFGLPFPDVDASSGTVTQAAMTVADTLGATCIVLAGADLSYPATTTYARGSYVHALFYSDQSRLRPSETRHHKFFAERPGLYELPRSPRVFSTPVLDHYRDELTASANSCAATVYALPGSQAPLPLPAPPDQLPAPRVQRLSTAEPERGIILNALTRLSLELTRLGESNELELAAGGPRSFAPDSLIPALLPISCALATRRNLPAGTLTLSLAHQELQSLVSQAISRL